MTTYINVERHPAERDKVCTTVSIEGSSPFNPDTMDANTLGITLHPGMSVTITVSKLEEKE